MRVRCDNDGRKLFFRYSDRRREKVGDILKSFHGLWYVRSDNAVVRSFVFSFSFVPGCVSTLVDGHVRHNAPLGSQI